MLAYFPGRKRSLDRIIEIARDAAFPFRTVTPVRDRSLVEFVPAAE
ncbi:MAG TPA: hypothetical protein VI434_13680 [Candidatus Dormibacteraeota bacterium]